ncbi:MAG: sulfatase-like hydrolase/transferase [Lentisphaerae bacterium]|jgi:arylsulfatase A-like enzyme|nr:sulfatase-like hydrolase/transferase [Lentisphaerota bacterium]MBT4817167.1 sulfatase-like hydrolase/transferase [Lentisphaerota bacterium]MBT5612191.1 sulfatase-like hydrolase/transferase [Lentisphaerota bacterium]MBT7061118.1 sulfatase-like hydrolase/transferase [Lentisphaerota bacterium]MBT7843447.1 sulfatase-like hydrolase/transferase [Lentisphaerota bacterium]
MATRPNIVFILSDQQRWDTLGCYGRAPSVTPILDTMAEEGTVFTTAITPQPVCGPARACLQTGRFASETGNSRNGVPLPEDCTTVATCLAAEGYDLGYVGKWHLAGDPTAPPPPARRGGFSGYWVGADLSEYVSNGYAGIVYDRDGRTIPFEGYRTDVYTNYALDYLRTRPADQPFYLFLSYVEPHPQPYHKGYQGPEPPNRDGIVHDYLRYDCPLGTASKFREHAVPEDLRKLDDNGWMQFPEYLSCCHRVDANVGRVLNELTVQGVAENTLVVYGSDHGSHFHTRGGNDKCTCHDSSVRVPLIARGPGFAAGHIVETPVSLIDVPPTLLATTQTPVPPQMRGTDLRCASRTESAYIEIRDPTRKRVERAIRTSAWTYCVGKALDASPEARYTEALLYDMVHDPAQLTNLIEAPEHTQTKNSLHDQLRSWMDIAGDQTEIALA